jgi:hypothetical protein
MVGRRLTAIAANAPRGSGSQTLLLKNVICIHWPVIFGLPFQPDTHASTGFAGRVHVWPANTADCDLSRQLSFSRCRAASPMSLGRRPQATEGMRTAESGASVRERVSGQVPAPVPSTMGPCSRAALMTVQAGLEEALERVQAEAPACAEYMRKPRDQADEVQRRSASEMDR